MIMPALLIDQSLKQLEQMLQAAISIGMKARKLIVPDVNGLKAQISIGTSGTPTWKDGDFVFVTSKQNVYEWVQSSVAADDGDIIIRPNDLLATATGRWRKYITSMLIGAVNAAMVAAPPVTVENVILHNGDFSDEILSSRIYGRSPCVAIHFAGGEHRAISQIPGALYDYRVKFDIWSVSRNFRDRFEAALGSPIPAEAALDPGVMVIHGAVKKLLAGKSGQDELGELGNSGVKWLEIHEESLVESREAERIFVMSLGTEILASLDNLDDPGLMVSPTEIDVQRKEADAPSANHYDLTNCVTSGLTVPQQVGFIGSVAAGTAIIESIPLAVSGASHTFTADVDTYRQLTPLGAWIFTVVAHNDTAPIAAAGNLMVGVTVTDAAGIVLDRIIASIYQDSESADVIPI